MLKTLISSMIAVSALLTAAEASPRPSTVAACSRPASVELARGQAATPRLLPIRDVRATMGGGNGGAGGGGGGSGGNANSCWSTCFNTYNACMDKGPKDYCVSRMKTCLAICDTSAN